KAPIEIVFALAENADPDHSPGGPIVVVVVVAKTCDTTWLVVVDDDVGQALQPGQLGLAGTIPIAAHGLSAQQAGAERSQRPFARGHAGLAGIAALQRTGLGPGVQPGR